jgi:hypothetical protein
MHFENRILERSPPRGIRAALQGATKVSGAGFGRAFERLVIVLGLERQMHRHLQETGAADGVLD